MKKLLLAIIILTIGVTACWALRNSTQRLQQQAAGTRETLTTQTALLTDARSQLTHAQEKVRDLKQTARAQEHSSASAVDSLLSLAGAKYLTPAQREQLLAELGFNWKTTGDYLIVSKETLHAASLDGIRKMKLNPAAADVLAMTPDERAGLDTLTQSLDKSYQDWVVAHAQRGEPGGKVVAQYTLPADADFSQNFSRQFTDGIKSALGDERGNLLQQYSLTWLDDLGVEGNGTTSLTVSRYTAGDDSHLNFALKKSGGGSMSTDVSPYQPFPPAFLPLFPNGWTDLAAHEGFALPKSFQKK